MGGTVALRPTPILNVTLPAGLTYQVESSTNGGAWTAGVAITGAEQTLADGQKLTFAAVDGHTVGDQWVIGNLKSEPTTESGDQAQITDATARLLNPNAPPTWTDDGGETVVQVNFTNGTGIFTGNVGTVTVTGTCDATQTVASWCNNGVLQEDTCAGGQGCGWSTQANGWRCQAPNLDPCQGAPALGECNGGALSWCTQGTRLDSIRACVAGQSAC